MNGLNDCWECGQRAPSGVCVGPHEGFSLAAARLALNVGRTTMEWGARTARNACRVCGAVCRGERVTCSDACYTANLQPDKLSVVGTCDGGDCDGETVGVRLDESGEWLAVCAAHSEVHRAMEAIWRLTCLPFSDNDRYKIQNIALSWIDGTGPREGSAVAQWLADPAPSAPPASDPDDLPCDDGPEEPWCWGPGSPEHETNQCLHNGRDE